MTLSAVLRRIARPIAIVAALVLGTTVLSIGAASARSSYVWGSGFGSTAQFAEWSAENSAYAAAGSQGYSRFNCSVVMEYANPQGPDQYFAQAELFCFIPPPPPTGPTGPVVSVYSGKCMDVAGANTANGTPVQIYSCNGTNAQSWMIASDGTIRALGKCLDVASGGTTNGTYVQLYDCNGTGSQQWTVLAGGSLKNPQSGRCLDELGFQSADGSRLGIWDCNGLNNQQWTLPS